MHSGEQGQGAPEGTPAVPSRLREVGVGAVGYRPGYSVTSARAASLSSSTKSPLALRKLAKARLV